MKPTLNILLSVLLTVFVHKTSTATAYNITTNTSWATLIGYSCTGCTFNISSGVTLTLDQQWGGCGTCTFTGGTVNITTNFTLNTGASFTNTNLFLNGPATFQATTFTNDTIAVNQSSTFYTGNTFTNSRISFNAATTIQGSTFTNDSLHVNNQNLTLQGTGTNTFTNSHFAISGTSALNSTTAMTLTNSVFAFSNTSYLNNNGGTFTASGSTVFLNGSSYMLSSSPIVLKNSSELLIGDGTLASNAYLFYNAGTALNIVDNSMIKVSNGNNSYQNGNPYKYTSSGGVNTNYNTSSNSISCGGTNPHACTTNYVFGCATINSVGALGCLALAIADLELSAATTGDNTIALSWSYTSNNNADHFQVQRSTNSQNWTTIGTVSANAYAVSDYYFNDPDASAGINNYRIQVIDKNGSSLYSKISVVTMASRSTSVNIYPNPVTGHTFYIRTASTSAILLNVYTLSGQLLFKTSLKGQTIYPVNLPASVTPGTCMIAQIINEEGTKAFNLLSR